MYRVVLVNSFLPFLEEKKLLHPSQIGFLKDNRTADHIFTLRTLIEKYSHHHNQKVYACFVDFKKAFDSVWHEGLFLSHSKLWYRGKSLFINQIFIFKNFMLNQD